ncbi:MAG: amino acid transporter [Gemmataceae bacterium]|nr:amino acid transporter [Gemmataceae bacterium]MDW8265105.1 amino acid transporter [Gemmataceae bacterium]
MSDTSGQSSGHHQGFWLWVMCLTGVDYFSTLGYQPSIAYEATGRLAPLATIVLVAMTLLGALPVYCFVAGRSSNGQGSIGMMEHLVHGWTGKILVLVLLGFAATDFVITKTLSAADAAEHLLGNPLWPVSPERVPMHRQQLVVTMLMLIVLGGVFLRGFREVIGLAVGIVGIYMTLNAIVIAAGIDYLARHPEKWAQWQADVWQGPAGWHMKEPPPFSGNSPWVIALVCVVLFPKLALGLSGFETGVAVMPLIRGQPDDDPARPRGRIRNTRFLLATAAFIMSAYLLGSALVVSTLIEPEALVSTNDDPDHKPPAQSRALAYLAHGEGAEPIHPWFGQVFGTLYDLSTLVILWFAGASAMAGLLNLVPQYLPRYGMAPEWARAMRPLVILFTLINLFVTWVFDANVEAQGGAYATGVLVLMLSACLATVIQRWREGSGHWLWRTPWYFAGVCAAFLYTTVAIIVEKPSGMKIASCFIAAIIVSSIISRAWRSMELRFVGFQFKDEDSRFLWESMKHLEFPVLVPHRPGRRHLADKEEEIRKIHRLAPDVPIVFIEAELGDASDFYQEPLLEVRREGERWILRVQRCASIAHTLAAIGLELSRVGKPPELHFGWANESPLKTTLGFLLFGEGNVPWMVRELILKAEPNPERQPRVIIG